MNNSVICQTNLWEACEHVWAQHKTSQQQPIREQHLILCFKWTMFSLFSEEEYLKSEKGLLSTQRHSLLSPLPVSHTHLDHIHSDVFN